MEPADLLRCYDQAAAQTEPGTLMIQELIPGSTHVQYSFAALCDAGRVVASVTAERVRQHPPDFGRSSTFVITVDNDQVERAARVVLAHLGLTGLAEIEFKKDPRDGSYHLLDINLRVWGWHTIARRDGLDFLAGDTWDELHAPAGIRWLRLTTDLAVGLQGIRAGQLSTRSYLRSLRGRHERAVAAGDDPLPGLVEVPSHVLSEVFSSRPRDVSGALAAADVAPKSRRAGGPHAGPRRGAKGPHHRSASDARSAPPPRTEMPT
jgi:predicted ATP-grasp superfamily ATP-dependent carboligase